MGRDIQLIARIASGNIADMDAASLRHGLNLISRHNDSRCPIYRLPVTQVQSMPIGDTGASRQYHRKPCPDSPYVNVYGVLGLVSSAAIADAKRRVAILESAREQITIQARCEADRAVTPFVVRGAPRSGIRGRACPIRSEEIRQFSAVTRDSRQSTVAPNLGQLLSAGHAGINRVVETDDGKVIAVSASPAGGRGVLSLKVRSVTLRDNGRLRTRGTRGGRKAR